METGGKRTQVRANISIHILLSLAAVVSQLPASAEAKQMWHLEQRHGMKGKASVFFTPTSVAVTTERGSHYVSSAPDWNVCAFRTDDRLVCRMSREAFYKHFHFDPGPDKAKEFRRTGNASICGQNANVLDNAYKTIWVWQPANIPNQIGNLICAWYKAPSLNGIVLKCLNKNAKVERVTPLNYNFNDKLSSEIETKTLRSVPYRADEFKLPSGFRAVKDFEQTFYSSSGRKEMESIFDQLGIGEELGSRKGK